jgi:hypothetical protein
LLLLRGCVRGLEQAREQWVWRAWFGPELWLVERAYEEWVVDALDGSDFAGGVGGGNSHPMFDSNVLQRWRKSVRARRVFADTLTGIQFCKERSTCELDCDRLVLKRALEQGDDGGAARAVLSVGGVIDTCQVPSVLDQHVLKSASSADERDALLARSAHNLMGRLRIAVRAAGPDNEGRPRGGDPGGVTNRVGRDDSDIDGNPSVL